jgi:hypothetical protein
MEPGLILSVQIVKRSRVDAAGLSRDSPDCDSYDNQESDNGKHNALTARGELY